MTSGHCSTGLEGPGTCYLAKPTGAPGAWTPLSRAPSGCRFGTVREERGNRYSMSNGAVHGRRTPEHVRAHTAPHRRSRFVFRLSTPRRPYAAESSVSAFRGRLPSDWNSAYGGNRFPGRGGAELVRRATLSSTCPATSTACERRLPHEHPECPAGGSTNWPGEGARSQPGAGPVRLTRMTSPGRSSR